LKSLEDYVLHLIGAIDRSHILVIALPIDSFYIIIRKVFIDPTLLQDILDNKCKF